MDKDELFPDVLFPDVPLLSAQSFRIAAFTFGGVRDLWRTEKFQLGLGGNVTFYSKPAALDASYGANPVSLHVFLRVRPGSHQH